MQDADILLIHPLWAAFEKSIVGDSKGGGWEQVILVAIGGEGSWLTHQRPDHMTIIDAVLLFADQSRQLEGRCAPDKSFQRLCANTDKHTGADQAGRHGVHVSFNVDRAEAADGHAQLLTGSKRGGWQEL